jgi:hypothetical protein
VQRRGRFIYPFAGERVQDKSPVQAVARRRGIDEVSFSAARFDHFLGDNGATSRDLSLNCPLSIGGRKFAQKESTVRHLIITEKNSRCDLALTFRAILMMLRLLSRMTTAFFVEEKSTHPRCTVVGRRSKYRKVLTGWWT